MKDSFYGIFISSSTSPCPPSCGQFYRGNKERLSRLEKYSARSSRREFWLWTLHVFLIAVPLNMVTAAFPADSTASNLLLILYIPIVPSLAMWVRRIHDTGHRIWWCFIPLVGSIMNTVFLCSETNISEKRWSRTTSS